MVIDKTRKHTNDFIITNYDTQYEGMEKDAMRKNKRKYFRKKEIFKKVLNLKEEQQLVPHGKKRRKSFRKRKV